MYVFREASWFGWRKTVADAEMPQGCLRSYHNQQSRRLNLPERFRRWPEQAEHKRLPRPRRNISRVRAPPPSPPFSLPANTLYRVHAITTRLYPLSSTKANQTTSSLSPNLPRSSNPVPAERPDPPSGIEVLETENFRLQCFSTLTGTKFLLFTEPQQPNVDSTLRKIYELYADYVMKNPFYQMEMPVRCEAFDRKLAGYLRPLNSR